MQASAEDIMEHCRSHIAHFKVPRSVDFYAGALPKALKDSKRELREKFWSDRSDGTLTTEVAYPLMRGERLISAVRESHPCQGAQDGYAG
jgi:hypothetical protein